MVEVVDGVLQFLEDILLTFALARNVGNRPDRATVMTAGLKRLNAQPDPTRRLAPHAGKTNFLLQAAALARALEQSVDRLRDLRFADEGAFHRPDVVGVDDIHQLAVGGVGIDHPPGGIGHDDSVGGAVGHGLEDRIAVVLAGHAQDTGRDGKQRKHADHAEDRQQNQNVRAGVLAPDNQQPGSGGSQHARDQQHEGNAAALETALDHGRRPVAEVLRHHASLESRHHCS